jgi:hypothetical protein
MTSPEIMPGAVRAIREICRMTVDNGKEPFRLGFLTAVEVPERGFVGGLLVTNHFGRPLEFQCTAPLKPNRTQEILYGPTLLPYLLGDLIGRTLVDKVGIKPHIVLTERDDLLFLGDLVEMPVACVGDAAVGDLPPQAAVDGQPENGAGAVPAASAESTAGVCVDLNASPQTLDAGPPSESAELPAPAQVSVDDAAEAGRAPAPPPSGETPIDLAAAARIETATARQARLARETEEQAVAVLSFRLGRQVLRFHTGHADHNKLVAQGAALVPGDADLREPFERVREALHEAVRSGGSR